MTRAILLLGFGLLGCSDKDAAATDSGVGGGDAADGTDGADGSDGSDGADGTDGADGSDGGSGTRFCPNPGSWSETCSTGSVAAFLDGEPYADMAFNIGPDGNVTDGTWDHGRDGAVDNSWVYVWDETGFVRTYELFALGPTAEPFTEVTRTSEEGRVLLEQYTWEEGAPSDKTVTYTYFSDQLEQVDYDNDGDGTADDSCVVTWENAVEGRRSTWSCSFGGVASSQERVHDDNGMVIAWRWDLDGSGEWYRELEQTFDDDCRIQSSVDTFDEDLLGYDSYETYSTGFFYTGNGRLERTEQLATDASGALPVQEFLSLYTWVCSG